MVLAIQPCLMCLSGNRRAARVRALPGPCLPAARLVHSDRDVQSVFVAPVCAAAVVARRGGPIGDLDLFDDPPPPIPPR
jgi:hypothetical protein